MRNYVDVTNDVTARLSHHSMITNAQKCKNLYFNDAAYLTI